MDADILCVGRVEAALELLGPGGAAPEHPLGAVPDYNNDGATFNAGVMAVRTSHAMFREMLRAAAHEEIAWDGRYAEQVRFRRATRDFDIVWDAQQLSSCMEAICYSMDSHSAGRSAR